MRWGEMVVIIFNRFSQLLEAKFTLCDTLIFRHFSTRR